MKMMKKLAITSAVIALSSGMLSGCHVESENRNEQKSLIETQEAEMQDESFRPEDNRPPELYASPTPDMIKKNRGNTE